jgi:hypothetical protein
METLADRDAGCGVIRRHPEQEVLTFQISSIGGSLSSGWHGLVQTVRSDGCCRVKCVLGGSCCTIVAVCVGSGNFMRNSVDWRAMSGRTCSMLALPLPALIMQAKVPFT